MSLIKKTFDETLWTLSCKAKTVPSSLEFRSSYQGDMFPIPRYENDDLHPNFLRFNSKNINCIIDCCDWTKKWV